MLEFLSRKLGEAGWRNLGRPWNRASLELLESTDKCINFPSLCFHMYTGHSCRQISTMTRIAIMLAAVVLALALASKPAAAQDPGLVNSAKQRNVVDVQFFADSNFQQINTPFAYYDFPPIQAGSCSTCEDFPVSIGLAQMGLAETWASMLQGLKRYGIADNFHLCCRMHQSSGEVL